MYYGRSKFHATKVVYQGMTFDSQRELARYLELEKAQAEGRIYGLRRQVKFELIPAQREPDTVGPKGDKKRGRLLERPVCYIADFVYTTADGKQVVEDSNGVRTPEYVIKRKLLLWRYGIRIFES